MVEQIIQGLESNGYAVVDGALSQDELRLLNEFFEKNRSAFQAARVGTGKERIEAIRGDHTFWIDPVSPPEDLTFLIVKLETIRNALNRSFYLGLQEFECHFAYYPPETFYKKHLDRFESKSGRRLSFVFYLNLVWKESDGGELIMYNKQGVELQKVFPFPGRLVCFLSDEFPHEVKASSRERRSFTGWMHTKIIY